MSHEDDETYEDALYRIREMRSISKFLRVEDPELEEFTPPEGKHSGRMVRIVDMLDEFDKERKAE